MPISKLFWRKMNPVSNRVRLSICFKLYFKTSFSFSQYFGLLSWGTMATALFKLKNIFSHIWQYRMEMQGSKFAIVYHLYSVSLSAHLETLKVELVGRACVSEGPHVGCEPPAWHGCCNIFRTAVGQTSSLLIVFSQYPLESVVFLNVAYSKVGPFAGEFGVSWNLPGQFITLFLPFKAESQPVRNPKSAESPNSGAISNIHFCLSLSAQSPSDCRLSIPPAALNSPSCLCLGTYFLHTNTHRDTCQEFAHTPAEMQISSWIDKKPTRWSAKTIWVDMPRTCLCFSSPPALQ